MSKTEQYLEALKATDRWVLVSEWAEKVGELYPDILEAANVQANNQAQDTTGLREIAARIASRISRGRYVGKIQIDLSERPRKVRFITDEEYQENAEADIEEDLASLTRIDIIRRDLESLDSAERYRLEEFESIAKQLRSFNGLEFELDHAAALLNEEAPGKHHPDNLQLLLKAHNGKKHNKNWIRFSLDEQLAYIQTAISVQEIVASRMDIQLVDDVLSALLERLKNIYD